MTVGEGFVFLLYLKIAISIAIKNGSKKENGNTLDFLSIYAMIVGEDRLVLFGKSRIGELRDGCKISGTVTGV
jgi:hypothetical protein